MSLDGLRAWIGEVERKLGVRTRVFLVLTVIAIGIGGAAAYLAIDARDSSVSEGDVQELQEQLEARIGEGGGGGTTDVAQLEAELDELRTQVEQLSGEGGSSGKNQSNDSSGGTNPSGTAGGASGKLKQLLEQTAEQNGQLEEEQAGK